MSSWAYRFSDMARAEKGGWPAGPQARLYEILDSLCRDPQIGKYFQDNDCWIYKEGARPQFTIAYRLDSDSSVLRVDYVGIQIIEPREILFFLSYSHEDISWFERVRKAIEPLEDWDIRIWCDKDINPGQVWLDLIRQNIQNTSGALLLVSEAFLASEFIREHELNEALKRAEKPTEPRFLLLWIPLMTQDMIERDSFGQRVLKYQALLNPKTPLSVLRGRKLGRALRKLSQEVSRVVYRELRRRAE